MQSQTGSFIKKKFLTLGSMLTKKEWASLAFAVLITFTTFLIVALKQPIGFDGAMNLQVAQNLAEHGKYARNYEYATVAGSKPVAYENGYNLFPQEVETNGPYIFVAALSIKIFGHNQFAYQLSNLLFIAGTAAIIWWLFKRWLLAATFIPALILFTLPTSFGTSLGGFGELPALFWVLLSFLLLTKATTSKGTGSINKLMALSFISFGFAVNTKTYIAGSLPALLIGVAWLLYYRRKDIGLRNLLVTAPFVAVAPILYELFRFVNLGSLHLFLVWWRHQLKEILMQAGVLPSSRKMPGDNTTSLIDGLMHRAHALITIAPSFVFLIVALLAVTISCLILLRKRYKERKNLSKTTEERLADLPPEFPALIMLVTMFLAYLAWWLVLLPVTKTFPRRTFPIMLPLEIVIWLALCITASFYSIKDKKKILNLGIVYHCGRYLTGVLIIVMFLFSALNSAKAFNSGRAPGYVTLDDYSYAAKQLKSIGQGHTIYGLNWWSAPTISLMSGVTIHNISYAQYCKLDQGHDLIIWEKIASAITKSETPYDNKLSYGLYQDVHAAKLYTVKPIAKTCK